MYIAFVFQFSIIFTFLLPFSPQKKKKKMLIRGQSHFTHKNTSNSDIHLVCCLETSFIIFVTIFIGKLTL